MLRNRQADGLATLENERLAKVIAVSSGKGGVGKTNVAANLSIALAGLGRDVMLLDADVSLANVDVLLGLQPRFNLANVLSGDVDLESTIVHGPADIRIIPASSGEFSMTNLSLEMHAAIINSFGELVRQPEILIVDTAPGIAENVARYVGAAHEAVVVICDDPPSITDAYALIKVFSRNYGITHFQIITNQTQNRFAGKQLFSKIQRVSNAYLDVVIRHLGNVPDDDYLRLSVQEQKAVVQAYPRSVSGKAFTEIARRVDEMEIRRDCNGGVQFFLEQLLRTSQTSTGMLQ